MTDADMHRDLAAVFERHGRRDLARDHRELSAAFAASDRLADTLDRLAETRRYPETAP